jgi:AcrR family transcriptional regulator
MDATVQLLEEGSTFADLPIETIADRAGISRTTFYDYFGDKRELLLRLSGAILRDWLEEADEWRPGGDLTESRAGLTRIIRSRIAVQRHPVMRAVVEATAYDPAIRAAWHAHHENEIARAIRLFEAEREAGRFQPYGSTLEARARALHWCVEQTVMQEIVLGSSADEDEVIAAICDVVIAGVRGIRD